MKPYTYLCILLIGSLFLLSGSCSKTDATTSTLVGKWYNESISTKKEISPTNCTLKDTIKYKIKDVNADIYEFTSDGRLSITTYAGGTKNTSIVDYKFENNNLTMTVNGTTSPAIIVSNLTADGWRYEQSGRSYCTSPYTKFTEYYNFKKY